MRDLVIYKIECEWEMPFAQGYYLTKDRAQEAIDTEDWSIAGGGRTLDEIKGDGLVSIEEIVIKNKI